MTDNRFDFLRLVFASTVFAYHLMFLALSPGERLENGFAELSLLAVQGFFVVSGALVYGSLQRSGNLGSYTEKRIRRLYPAYAVIVLVPALYALFKTGAIVDVGRYLGANLIFLNFLEPNLPGLFEGQVEPTVNGSLWTLKIEVMFLHRPAVNQLGFDEVWPRNGLGACGVLYRGRGLASLVPMVSVPTNGRGAASGRSVFATFSAAPRTDELFHFRDCLMDHQRPVERQMACCGACRDCSASRLIFFRIPATHTGGRVSITYRKHRLRPWAQTKRRQIWRHIIRSLHNSFSDCSGARGCGIIPAKCNHWSDRFDWACRCVELHIMARGRTPNASPRQSLSARGSINRPSRFAFVTPSWQANLIKLRRAFLYGRIHQSRI